MNLERFKTKKKKKQYNLHETARPNTFDTYIPFFRYKRWVQMEMEGERRGQRESLELNARGILTTANPTSCFIYFYSLIYNSTSTTTTTANMAVLKLYRGRVTPLFYICPTYTDKCVYIFSNYGVVQPHIKSHFISCMIQYCL